MIKNYYKIDQWKKHNEFMYGKNYKIFEAWIWAEV